MGDTSETNTKVLSRELFLGVVALKRLYRKIIICATRTLFLRYGHICLHSYNMHTYKRNASSTFFAYMCTLHTCVLRCAQYMCSTHIAAIHFFRVAPKEGRVKERKKDSRGKGGEGGGGGGKGEKGGGGGGGTKKRKERKKWKRRKKRKRRKIRGRN